MKLTKLQDVFFRLLLEDYVDSSFIFGLAKACFLNARLSQENKAWSFTPHFHFKEA